MRRCAVPPWLLAAIAGNTADSGQRERALRTLAQDTAFRADRQRGIRRTMVATQAQDRPAPRRSIYDTHASTQLPGTTEVRAEGGPATGDPAADEAYDGLGATFEFYLSVLGRDSIDDAGLPLVATVHYDLDYDNAFWNGEQMVFGDGDGDLFTRFTVSVDVIGHELTHGVTGDEVNLIYQDQSGALNESLSDVFGSLVKQYQLNQSAAEADWLIGAGLFTERVQGVALRSLKAPGTAYDDPVLGKDPQPSSMAGYLRTSEDNGGVHLNSGIPNHAFYLAAVALGGNAWDVAGKIWYDSVRDSRLTADATFGQFAAITVAQAETVDDATRRAVEDAWTEVGVTPGEL